MKVNAYKLCAFLKEYSNTRRFTMEKYDLVIKSDKVFVDGRLMDCNIGIKNGISRIKNGN